MLDSLRGLWPHRWIAAALAAGAFGAILLVLTIGDEQRSGPDRDNRIVAEARAELRVERDVVADLDRSLGLRRYAGRPHGFEVSGGWCRVSVVLSAEELALYGEVAGTLVKPDGSTAVELEPLGRAEPGLCVGAARDALRW